MITSPDLMRSLVIPRGLYEGTADTRKSGFLIVPSALRPACRMPTN